MRLWHTSLIPRLPRQQLLGQHRECCALRGKGWGRPHATVNYVFRHPYWWLWLYHREVMDEMERRGYHVEDVWQSLAYRGRLIGYDYSEFTMMLGGLPDGLMPNGHGSCPIYPEHDEKYLNECIENLRRKGIEL